MNLNQLEEAEMFLRNILEDVESAPRKRARGSMRWQGSSTDRFWRSHAHASGWRGRSPVSSAWGAGRDENDGFSLVTPRMQTVWMHRRNDAGPAGAARDATRHRRAMASVRKEIVRTQ